MEEKIDYLNIIDRIDIPTDEDFYDYFRILTLLLQEEADKGRWNDIKPENFKAYDNSNDGTIEVGSKLEYDFISFVYEFGVRFQVKCSVGYYSLFLCLLPLWQKATKYILSNSREEIESELYFDCRECNERIICDSIYQMTEQIIDSIEYNYPDCERILNEVGELIGIEVRLGGDYRDIYNQTCRFIDFILLLLIKFRPTEAPSSTSIITSSYNSGLYYALRPYTSSFSPSFKIFRRCQETIEEIYNKPHGIDNQNEDEEPPF